MYKEIKNIILQGGKVTCYSCNNTIDWNYHKYELTQDVILQNGFVPIVEKSNPSDCVAGSTRRLK